MPLSPILVIDPAIEKSSRVSDASGIDGGLDLDHELERVLIATGKEKSKGGSYLHIPQQRRVRLVHLLGHLRVAPQGELEHNLAVLDGPLCPRKE